jgi:hypothetical protein
MGNFYFKRLLEKRLFTEASHNFFYFLKYFSCGPFVTFTKDFGLFTLDFTGRSVKYESSFKALSPENTQELLAILKIKISLKQKDSGL